MTQEIRYEALLTITKGYQVQLDAPDGLEANEVNDLYRAFLDYTDNVEAGEAWEGFLNDMREDGAFFDIYDDLDVNKIELYKQCTIHFNACHGEADINDLEVTV